MNCGGAALREQEDEEAKETLKSIVAQGGGGSQSARRGKRFRGPRNSATRTACGHLCIPHRAAAVADPHLDRGRRAGLFSQDLVRSGVNFFSPSFLVFCFDPAAKYRPWVLEDLRAKDSRAVGLSLRTTLELGDHCTLIILQKGPRVLCQFRD